MCYWYVCTLAATQFDIKVKKRENNNSDRGVVCMGYWPNRYDTTGK